MHGRLKVKTTEEQQRAKQEERAKKLKLYDAATKRAFDKRKAGELDEELLEITGQVLQPNPDFYTFWNIRKETLLHLQQAKERGDLQKLYRNELDFLEMCLKVNPKSYGTWHHRCFVMDHIPEPDWVRELQLCNLFLQYDERNFHCWDYRRFVVQRYRVPESEEFDFTTSKISSNFSNYSSWHYRSKLLPVLHPDPSQPSGVTEDIMQSEFELVQNGLYTDPDDQSNWFYHRWLLGRGAQEQKVNCMFVSRSRGKLLVSFSKSIKLGANNCAVHVNGTTTDMKWRNQTGTLSYSTLWIGEMGAPGRDSLAQTGQELQIELQVAHADQQVCEQALVLPAVSDQACVNWSASEVSAQFRREFSAVDEATLKQQLEAVKELQEMENTNKWAMLTRVLLMKAVDPALYEEPIMSLLQQLESLDATRMTYYRDIRSRFIVEQAIESLDKSRELCLAGHELTMMFHLELLPMVQKLDLSNNTLTTTRGFSFLQNVEQLNLSCNQLRGCRALNHLPCLTHLDLSNNSIAHVDSLKILQSCPRLKCLCLSGNPLCEDECVADKLRELFPSVEILLAKDAASGDSV